MQRRTKSGLYTRRSWRNAGLAAIAGAAVLVLAACAGGGNGSPSSSKTSSTAVAEVPSLSVAMPGPITGVDPANSILQQNVWFVHLLGGNLFASVPGTATKVVPAIASGGTLAPDGLSAVVKIKPNLKFADGSPLTAADVVSTFTRDFRGSNIGALFYAGITAASPDGANAVKLTFSAPNPNYQTQLSEFPFAILPANSWKKPNFATDPVNAGQYMPEGSITGNTATLVANPHYPGPKPSVKKLVFHVIADPDAAANQLISGQIDWAPIILASRYKTFKSGGPVVGQLNESWGITNLTPNAKDPILSNFKVRQAIGYAIDRTQQAAIVSGGTAKPQNGPLAPNFPGSSSPVNQVFPATADLKKAKADLVGTGCASGCSFQLMTDNSSATDQTQATVLQQQLAAIGIKITIVSLDQTTYNTRIFADNFQLVLTGGGGFGFAPTLALMLDPQGPTNAMFSNWDSKTIGAAITKATTASAASQPAALTNLVKIYASDLPWLPLLSDPQISGVKAKYAKQIFFSPTGVPDVAALQ